MPPMQWWTRQKLRFKNPESRRQAVDQLADQGTEEAVEQLSSALQDDDAAVRLAVVQAFGRMKEGRVLPSLIQAMGDPDSEVREAVAATLVRVGGTTCFEVLVWALLHRDQAVR